MSAGVRAFARAVARAGALAVLAAGWAPGRAAAQAGTPLPVTTPPALGLPAPTPGDSLSVALMTIGPGDEVWARFGHDAIVLRDARTGAAVAYNWGMFDFNQPNFVGRFLTGDTKYWVQGIDLQVMLEHYSQVENRSIYLQELALAPAQRAALRDFLEWNSREENRYYRYDYYRDNCATRARDALDRVTGGAIRAALAGAPTGTSYRSHTRRLTDGDPAVYTGIQLALGRPADRPIDAWEESFLPVRMMAHLRGVRVRWPDGRVVPLVASERTAYAAPRPPEPAVAPDHTAAYALAGAALALAFAFAAWLAVAAGGVGRLALGLLAVGWPLVLGFFGVALLLAGTVTKHAAYMGRNWNLLGANALAFAVAGLAAAALVAGPDEAARRGRRAARAAWLVAALTAAGAVCVLIPGVGQQSGELFALLLPANLALAAALAWVARRRAV